MPANTFTYTANTPNDPNKFVGYDFGAHQGQTFNSGNLADGTKYGVANYLNNVDPNAKGWATQAASDLNKQFGTDIFKADNGERLSYGDEFVDGTKQGGKFFWGSDTPAARRAPVALGAPPPLFGTGTVASAPAQAPVTLPTRNLNTSVQPLQQVGGQLGQVNVSSASNQAAINALLNTYKA